MITEQLETAIEILGHKAAECDLKAAGASLLPWERILLHNRAQQYRDAQQAVIRAGLMRPSLHSQLLSEYPESQSKDHERALRSFRFWSQAIVYMAAFALLCFSALAFMAFK